MRIKSNWNSNADKYNQWEELSKDEVAELADKQIETLRAQLNIAVDELEALLDTTEEAHNIAQTVLTKISEAGK